LSAIRWRAWTCYRSYDRSYDQSYDQSYDAALLSGAR